MKKLPLILLLTNSSLGGTNQNLWGFGDTFKKIISFNYVVWYKQMLPPGSTSSRLPLSMAAKEEELLRMVDRYKVQGHFWRFLSLLQFPIILCLTLYFISRYLGADTLVKVSEPPIPGEVQQDKIPDKEYVNTAQNIINLIGTYQPTTARDQFETARDYFLDSAVASFDETQMGSELVTAEESDISQRLDVYSTRIVRETKGNAQVCLSGVRQKIVDRNPLPQQDVTYCFSFVVDEPFEGSSFGIAVNAFTQKLGPVERLPIPRKVAPKFEKSKKKVSKRALRKRASSKSKGSK